MAKPLTSSDYAKIAQTALALGRTPQPAAVDAKFDSRAEIQAIKNALSRLVNPRGAGVFSMIEDADIALSDEESIPRVLEITSNTLTAPRKLTVTTDDGTDYLVTNNTTGGQSIVFAGPSGVGVTVPSGATKSVLMKGRGIINPSPPEVEALLSFGGDPSGILASETAINLAFVQDGDVTYPPGTYRISTNVTLGGTGKTHHFARGAKLKIDAGRTVIIAGQLDAAVDQWIFDVSASGASVVWAATGGPSAVHPAWFGALGDGTTNDAIGIAAAATIGVTRGMTVEIPDPPQGFWKLDTPCKIGSDGASGQGLRLKFKSVSYRGAAALFKVTSSLPKGRAAIEIINVLRCDIDGLCVDGNGLADYCLQTRNVPGQFPSWHNVRQQITLRNARTYDYLSGEPDIEAVFVGSLADVTATGHPFANGDEIYLAKVWKSSVIPSEFTAGVVYFVVGKTTNTFQLSATLGGSPITPSTAGSGRYLFCKKTRHDCSIGLDLSPHFGDTTVSTLLISGMGTVARYRQKSIESFETTLLTPWFQNMGDPANTLLQNSCTFNAAANTISVTAPLSLATGDLVFIWADTDGAGDSLPSGLAKDTEYWIVNGNQLALMKGGAPVDFTTNGTGNLLVLKWTGPIYDVFIDGGSLNIISAAHVVSYAGIRIGGFVGCQGARVTSISFEAQSWRYFTCDQVVASQTNQVGGLTLVGGHHSDIFGGSDASIEWGMLDYSCLAIVGGQYGRNIKISATAGVGPVDLSGAPRLITDGKGIAATVKGTMTRVAGRWIENQTEVSRHQRVDVVGDVLSTGSMLNLGPSTGAALGVETSGNYSVLASRAPAGFILDATTQSAGSTGSYWELRETVASGNGYLSADTITMRSASLSVAWLTYSTGGAGILASATALTTDATRRLHLIGAAGTRIYGGTTLVLSSDGSGNWALGTASPIVTPTLPAAATDPATTQALTNAIRTALINRGITT